MVQEYGLVGMDAYTAEHGRRHYLNASGPWGARPSPQGSGTGHQRRYRCKSSRIRVGRAYRSASHGERSDLQDEAGGNEDDKGEFFDNVERIEVNPSGGSRTGLVSTSPTNPSQGADSSATDRSQSCDCPATKRSQMGYQGKLRPTEANSSLRGWIWLTEQSHRSGMFGLDRIGVEVEVVRGHVGTGW